MDPNENADLPPDEANSAGTSHSPAAEKHPVPAQQGGGSIDGIDNADLLMNGTSVTADGVGLVAEGAAEAVSAAGEVLGGAVDAVAGAADAIGGAVEGAGSLLEGASGCLDGCAGCSLAVLVALFAMAGTAMAVWG